MAVRDPTMHASCCRSQKFWMSVTTPFRRREGFARTNLRLWHGLRAAVWQQNQNEAKPECHSQKKPHNTPPFPGCFTSALPKTSVEIARVVELLCVYGEVAVAVAGAESPSETHTLGSYCDWRLTKR